MTTTVQTRPSTATRTGLAFALASAAAFGLSGPFAKSLLDIGWTPGAVVAARVGGAALVLLVPALMVLRRTGLPSARQARRVLAYGSVAVAATQLCFYSAVQYLSVGVALLIEYLAPVLLIGWQWVRTRQAPPRPVLLGAGVALGGMVLVLDVVRGFTLHPVGVLWALAAAVGLAGYFVLSDDTDPGSAVPPLVLTGGGMAVGALVLLGAGGLGVLPLATTAEPTRLAGAEVAWWVPFVLLVGVSTALSYLLGIAGVRRLGSSVASLVSLSEVVFAVVFALLLLGQQLSGLQVVGGALVLVGIAIVQRRR